MSFVLLAHSFFVQACVDHAAKVRSGERRGIAHLCGHFNFRVPCGWPPLRMDAVTKMLGTKVNQLL